MISSRQAQGLEEITTITTATDIMSTIKKSPAHNEWVFKIEAIKAKTGAYKQSSYKNHRRAREGYTSVWILSELVNSSNRIAHSLSKQEVV